MPIRSTVKVGALLLAGTLFSSSAFAAEGLELFQNLIAKGNAKISWDQVSETSSDSFTLINVTTQEANGNTGSIKALDIRGFKEVGNNRIVLKSMTASGVQGPTDDGGTFSISVFVVTDADVPTDIWDGDLTPEQKKQRIKFGNFTINGLDMTQRDNVVKMETMAITEADIPLDFRFDDKSMQDTSPAAAPATFNLFALRGLSGVGNGVTWSVDQISMNDFNLPTTLKAPIAEWLLYSNFSLTGLKSSMGGLQLFDLDSMTATIDRGDIVEEITSAAAIKGIKINLKAIPDPQTQMFVNEMGYDKIEANLVGNGSYNMRTGRATADKLLISLADMFDFNMSYAIDGYTQEVASQLMEMQANAATQGKQPDPMMFLPILSKIRLESIKMALTDKSLLEKVLNFQAKQMGTTGDQLAQGAPMMIGIGMAGLNMPELTEMVTSAIGSFLQNKGTLFVSAVPAEPVPIMDLVINGQANPQAIPGMINLSVTAQ